MSRASAVSARTAVPITNFAVQKQETPLNPKAFDSLEQLRRQGLNRLDLPASAKLDDTLRKATEYLGEIVGDINDRGAEQRTRRQNQQERLQRDGAEESEETKLEHEKFQEKVKSLTTKMDDSIRQVIDDSKWAAEVPASLNHIITTSRDIHNRQNQDAEEGEDIRQMTRPDETESASALFHAAQTTAESERRGQTLTERYSKHPSYVSFYGIRHQAQNPGERAPPLPHSDMWFAAEEGRTTQRTGRATQNRSRNATQDEEDSDIEIEGETISCKCPLTLQYFKDAVTSMKCPHNFEKKAIHDFINNSREKLPLSTDQIEQLNQAYAHNSREYAAAQMQMTRKQPVYVVCPERGCNAMLTVNDFRSNVALQRRAEKEKAQEERAFAAYDDDSEDSDDGMPRTQRRNVVAIGSSPTSGRRRTWVKGERDVSRVPDSQTPARSRLRGQTDIDEQDDSLDEENEEDEGDDD